MDCQACLYTNEKLIGKALSTFFTCLDINYEDLNRIQPFISHKLHELVIRLSTNSRFSLDSVNWILCIYVKKTSQGLIF